MHGKMEKKGSRTETVGKNSVLLDRKERHNIFYVGISGQP